MVNYIVVLSLVIAVSLQCAISAPPYFHNPDTFIKDITKEFEDFKHNYPILLNKERFTRDVASKDKSISVESLESKESKEDIGQQAQNSLNDAIVSVQKLQLDIKKMQDKIDKLLAESEHYNSSTEVPLVIKRLARSKEFEIDDTIPLPIQDELDDIHELSERIKRLRKKIERNLDENKVKNKEV